MQCFASRSHGIQCCGYRAFLPHPAQHSDELSGHALLDNSVCDGCVRHVVERFLHIDLKFHCRYSFADEVLSNNLVRSLSLPFKWCGCLDEDLVALCGWSSGVFVPIISGTTFPITQPKHTLLADVHALDVQQRDQPPRPRTSAAFLKLHFVAARRQSGHHTLHTTRDTLSSRSRVLKHCILPQVVDKEPGSCVPLATRPSAYWSHSKAS